MTILGDVLRRLRSRRQKLMAALAEEARAATGEKIAAAADNRAANVQLRQDIEELIARLDRKGRDTRHA